MMQVELDMPMKVVPAFLSKLWKMVENPDTDYLISWTEGGASFIIKNQTQFAQSLLPYYYKHSNMASFIRQLNMYGFRKVISADSGTLKGEKEEQEFSHPFFLHGQEHLLDHIKRKVTPTVTRNSQGFLASVGTEKVTKLLTEVEYVKNRQADMDGRLAVMKNENDALWGEVMNLRLKYSQQQKTVNKLIHFLSAIVQPNGRKRVFPEVGVGSGQVALMDRRLGVKKIKLGEDNSMGESSRDMGENVSLQEVLGGHYHQNDGDDLLLNEVVQGETPENEGHVSVMLNSDIDIQAALNNEQTISNTRLLTENLNIDINNMEMDQDNGKEYLSVHVTFDPNLESNVFNKDAGFSSVNLEESVVHNSPPLLIPGPSISLTGRDEYSLSAEDTQA